MAEINSFHVTKAGVPFRKFGFTGVRWRESKKFLIAMLFLLPSLFIFVTFTFIPLIKTIKPLAQTI